MANGADRRSRHFVLEGFTETEPYRSVNNEYRVPLFLSETGPVTAVPCRAR